MAKKIKKSTSGKVAIRSKRHLRIRKKVSGTAEHPRLCVTRSNRALVVQLIDDDKGVTLAASRSPKGKSVNLTLATELGKDIAKKALALGLKSVVFDRGGNLYHGRVAALAGGAREGGLQF